MSADQQFEFKDKNMALTEHLAELRTRLVHSLLGLVVAMGVCYGHSEYIFNLVRQPITKYLPGGGLVYTAPMDKFVAHIKIAFIAGVIISCPFWLYQVWLFIGPGLYKKERKYAALFIFAGSILFLTGVAFSYFVALPMAFDFLFTFGGDIDKPMITIEQYLDFFAQFCLMFGVSFELPMILAVLGMMGLVSQKFLIEKGRYAVMILAVLAAIITPPDIMSMVMMLVPMIILYYLGVFIVGFFERKRASTINE